MKRKTILPLLLAILFSISLFAGCDNDKSTTSTDDKSTTENNETASKETDETATVEKDDTIYEMTYFQMLSYNVAVKEFTPDDTALLAWIRDNFGVSITALEYKDKYASELQLLWVSGELPDIFTIPNDEMFTKLVEGGELKDLGKYYQTPERWPNLSATLPVYQAFGIRDGVQYCYFGGESKSPDHFDGEYSVWLMLPKMYYEQFGVDITTYEDFKTFCQTVLDSDAKTDDGGTIYPFGGVTLTIRRLFQAMYGLEAVEADVPVMTSDGKWAPAWATNEMYSALNSMNECWRLGYFDPETFSQDTQTLSSKLYNGQIAMFSGSYGMAEAFYNRNANFEGGPWAWYDEEQQLVIPKVAGNDKALGVSSYSVFPTYRSVLSADVSEGAADKFTDFVEWRHTEEGMFSDYYEGWPEETWIYDDNGKAIPYYSWWPNKDPKTDYVYDSEDAQKVEPDGAYWQIHNHFQFLFNPATSSLVAEKGSIKKGLVWYEWLVSYVNPTINNSGTAYLSTPVSVITYTQEASTIAADMKTVFDNWFGKLVTSATEDEFQTNYDSMIAELSALDVTTFSKDIAQGWSDALATNPDLADLNFPKSATAIDEIAGSLS